MKRYPAVSGQFYPESPTKLRQAILNLTPTTPQTPQDAIMAISPHAGYVYSGRVAAETFAKINIPDVVIVLGPNHHGSGDKLAIMEEGQWVTPLGTVNIEEQLAKKIINNSKLFHSDVTAHIPEHSLEVQVPFLQYHNPNVSIVPICISYISFSDCQQAGKDLAQAIIEFQKPVLIVASTDMTHYEPRKSASQKDKQAMEKIEELNPKALYHTVLNERISMCGIIPTTIALVTSLKLGAKNVDRVRYTDSGETSGDTHQVVGYAGYAIS